MTDDKEVQAGEPAFTFQDRVENSKQVYSTRRDCLSLKSRLLDLVKDPDYWSTLADFIHGCYTRQTYDNAMDSFLPTTEARLLHNELIRSILHNAHFAMSPPPNVNQERIKRLQPPVKHPHPPPVRQFLVPNTAVDLRHLPSLTQLNTRIGMLLSQSRLKADSKAIGLVFSGTKRYVLALLRESLSFIVNDGEKGYIILAPDQILHAVNANKELASIVSPSLSTKYASLLQ
jgi:hypothetical protein